MPKIETHCNFTSAVAYGVATQYLIRFNQPTHIQWVLFLTARIIETRLLPSINGVLFRIVS
jgi:hypothetical protein